MLLPQQSAAFKILRTRLKTIPPYSLSDEQIQSSGNAQSHLLSSGAHIIEDVKVDGGDAQTCINFASILQQFECMQKEHRLHAKSQLQRHRNSALLLKEVQRPVEDKQQSPVSDTDKPP